MDGSDTWLLPGERALWTGRPVSARPSLAEAGVPLYLAVGMVITTISWWGTLHTMPGIVKVMAVLTWGAAGLITLGALVNLLVITPRTRRRTLYEVTNYRIAVTRGQRVTSVYLDQAEQPVVRKRNGTSGLAVRTSAPSLWPASMFRPRGFGLATTDTVTELRALADAESARQVIAAARQQMIAREIDAPARPACGTDTDPPPGVSLGPGEHVLWTGVPASIPWWFGANDVCVSAFGLFWLACVADIGILATQSASVAFLVFLIPFALAGVYFTAGRVVLRRLRIRRSRYVVTTHRLITTWRPLRGHAPVVVQESLSALLPPSVTGGSVFTGRASEGSGRQRAGWKELTWPATTVAPPALIGLPDPQQVCGLIGAAQLAGRLP